MDEEENVLDVDCNLKHTGLVARSHTENAFTICKQFHGPFNSNNIDTIQKNISHFVYGK